MVHLLLAVIYLAFIGLGLPDSMLGAAWPSMYGALGAPVSYAGMVSMVIAAGTVTSSLLSDRMIRRFGAGLVTAVSVGLTALAMFGFSMSRAFWMLCLWAVPYGLGAGSVDAALNNFVALHYASRHMSWLHCMWGLGSCIGPQLLGRVLTGGGSWDQGYRLVALIQTALTAALFLSLPLWRAKQGPAGQAAASAPALTLRQVLALPGAKAAMATFFCYCAVEQTTMLWGSSYLHLYRGIPAETAASYGTLFFLGGTTGRLISGFLSIKLSDRRLVHTGLVVTAAGIAAVLLPLNAAPAGLFIIGLGCGPTFPALIHATPDNFGAERSQSVIGVQMASAYVGTCLMPPLFGLIASRIHIALLPAYLLVFLALLILSHELLLRAASGRAQGHAARR